MLERVVISLPRLPESFDGTTAAVIADIHAAPRRGGAAAVARVVEIANGLRPDFVFLLGDLVHRPSDAAAYLPALAGLRARLGVWACLGNHEHRVVWYSRHLGTSAGPPAAHWRRLYAEAGVGLLVNESKVFEQGGSRLWLLGVDDAYSRGDDLPAALHGVGDEDFRLAITHSPDLIDHPRAAELDLVLAAHTHGGQVRLPLLGPLYAPCRRPRERAAGLVRAGGALMYVTRGVGEGVPIRLGCPRELPLIELRAAPAP